MYVYWVKDVGFRDDETALCECIVNVLCMHTKRHLALTLYCSFMVLSDRQKCSIMFVLVCVSTYILFKCWFSLVLVSFCTAPAEWGQRSDLNRCFSFFQRNNQDIYNMFIYKHIFFVFLVFSLSAMFSNLWVLRWQLSDLAVSHQHTLLLVSNE